MQPLMNADKSEADLTQRRQGAEKKMTAKGVFRSAALRLCVNSVYFSALSAFIRVHLRFHPRIVRVNPRKHFQNGGN